MLYRLGKCTFCCFLGLFFKVEVEGDDVLPAAGPFILAANHPSYFDPPLLAAVVKRRLFFLAKEELFCDPISRLFFGDLGGIPVKRETSDIQAMRMALKVLREKPLVMFPQGLVGAPWDTVHPGVGFLARKSSVPLVAARIYGAEQIRPLRRYLLKRGRIRVVFAPVESVLPEETNESVAQRIMEKIQSL